MIPGIIYPPCQAACPISTDVQGYVALIAEERFEDALRLIRNTNPFPSVCGRICTHPCEGACRRTQVDQPIAIRGLERFAVDAGGEKAKLKKPKVSVIPHPKSPQVRAKVAVIGAGPAGLSCAHDLALLGYKVTVFEALPVAGGMLRVGIPDYRLPKIILENEINRIGELGVEIKTNYPIGKRITIGDLIEKRGYKAVFIATGAHRSLKLQVKGANLNGVMASLEFLKAFNLGKPLNLGRRVAVIGGGNTAIDCARTALRLGAREVTIVYRRSRNEMQAQPGEIDEALKEGVKIEFLSMPVRIIGKIGAVVAIECIKMKLGSPDESGRRRPIKVEGSEYSFPADNVISALGQNIDASFLTRKDQVLLSQRGLIRADRRTTATSREAVFAAGDCVSGPATATEAIAAGKKGAYAIDTYLRGEDISELEVLKKQKIAELKPDVVKKIRVLQREKMSTLPIEMRLRNFNPVEKGFSKDKAIREALRCLGCGSGAAISEAECVSCLTCVSVCPYGVPVVKKEGVVEIDISQCQACGICASECPAMAISLRRAAMLEDEIEKVVGKGKSKVAEFYCQYEAYEGKLPKPKKGGIKVMCTAKLHVVHLLKATEMGAEEIIVLSCTEKSCRFIDGGKWARKKVKEAQKILENIGVSPTKVVLRDTEESQNSKGEE
ncbi:MAG: NAD(P)-binding protein [Actinomycetota bacterium]|nr:NAD(P)-binding protein [Actinomycetota bacterium]